MMTTSLPTYTHKPYWGSPAMSCVRASVRVLSAMIGPDASNSMRIQAAEHQYNGGIGGTYKPAQRRDKDQ